MADGRWQMADGGWQIADGGWRMAGWRMADGGWPDGGWRMADGGWRMADGGWRYTYCPTRDRSSVRRLLSAPNNVLSKSNFRRMKVWQCARVLAREIYRETQQFPRTEMFGLVQQMRRAAVSVISNIAEGQGRRTDADGRHFAVIARGSLMEIEAQLVIAADLEYLTSDRAEALIEQTLEVVRLLNGLIRSYG
jgi:four helix bundle protein